jgi:hypothetical protein
MAKTHLRKNSPIDNRPAFLKKSDSVLSYSVILFLLVSGFLWITGLYSLTKLEWVLYIFDFVLIRLTVDFISAHKYEEFHPLIYSGGSSRRKWTVKKEDSLIKFNLHLIYNFLFFLLCFAGSLLHIFILIQPRN